MINLKLNAWTFAQITPKFKKKRRRRSRRRSQEEAALLGWHYLKKRNFTQKWVKFFGGFIKLVCEKREIYTLATNYSISMDFLEILSSCAM